MSLQVSPSVDYERPLVYLVGAGLSRSAFRRFPLAPPVDADFFSMALRLERSSVKQYARKVLSDVAELFGQSHFVGMEEYFRDIQARALIGAATQTSFGKRRKEWDKRVADLKELTRRLIIETTTQLRRKPNGKQSPIPNESAVTDTLISVMDEQDSIVSFNYDLVVEESLKRVKHGWRMSNGYGLPASFSSKFTEKGVNGSEDAGAGIRLFKLHGSINWSRLGGDSIRVVGYPYRIKKEEKTAVNIIAPGWFKGEVLKPPFNLIWNNARRVLEKCKTLVVIGYSMPQVDVLARAMMSEVVRLRKKHRKGIGRFVVVDPSEETRRKLIQFFLPCLDPTATRIEEFVDSGRFAGSMLPTRMHE